MCLCCSLTVWWFVCFCYMKMSFFHSLWFSGLPLVFVSLWYFPLPAMLSFALGFWTLMNDSSLFVFSPAACVLTRCGSWRLKCEKQPSGEIQVSRSYEIPNWYEMTLFSPSRSSSCSRFKPTLLATAKKGSNYHLFKYLWNIKASGTCHLHYPECNWVGVFRDSGVLC